MQSGCPYCNSNRLLIGFNDLKTKHPEILKEWNYNKNKTTPDKYTYCSSEKVWWICENGHEYESTISNRTTKNTGCPYCSNRYVTEGESDIATTNPDVLADWNYKKNAPLGLIPTMFSKGSDQKVWWICKKHHEYEASISNHIRLNRGCPYCAGRICLPGFNDLKTLRPDALIYWDYSKNNEIGLYPDHITSNSRQKAWWKCSKGHSRQATIYSYKPGSCPFCSDSSAKKVQNIETGIIYNTLSDASKACGLKSGDTISLCCKGKQKTAGGFHWRYID